jgi:hypothetical protein
MSAGLPPFDRYDPTPSGGPSGHVVLLQDELGAVGTGQLVYVDLGRSAGVEPGDVARRSC